MSFWWACSKVTKNWHFKEICLLMKLRCYFSPFLPSSFSPPTRSLTLYLPLSFCPFVCLSASLSLFLPLSFSLSLFLSLPRFLFLPSHSFTFFLTLYLPLSVFLPLSLSLAYYFPLLAPCHLSYNRPSLRFFLYVHHMFSPSFLLSISLFVSLSFSLPPSFSLPLPLSRIKVKKTLFEQNHAIIELIIDFWRCRGHFEAQKLEFQNVFRGNSSFLIRWRHK